MKGLSSGALQSTTSRAQQEPPVSADNIAARLITCPISRTASILMPALVVATFTLAHTFCVAFSASGMEDMSARSAGVKPLCTSAE